MLDSIEDQINRLLSEWSSLYKDWHTLDSWLPMDPDRYDKYFLFWSDGHLKICGLIDGLIRRADETECLSSPSKFIREYKLWLEKSK